MLRGPMFCKGETPLADILRNRTFGAPRPGDTASIARFVAHGLWTVGLLPAKMAGTPYPMKGLST